MKTRGVEVGECGYLVRGQQVNGKWEPLPGIVPPPFWSRLKDLVTKASRGEEYEADRARLLAANLGSDAEVVLFRLWVGKLGVDLPPGHYPGTLLWPWSRGWTEEAVDGYLAAPVVKAVAA
jgi:hypothetical protein